MVQEMIDTFHGDEMIQVIYREILGTAETLGTAKRYLEVVQVGSGVGYRAKEIIPQNTKLALYLGALKRSGTFPGNHDWSLGPSDLSYPLVVDGTPVQGDWPIGAMSMQSQLQGVC